MKKFRFIVLFVALFVLFFVSAACGRAAVEKPDDFTNGRVEEYAYAATEPTTTTLYEPQTTPETTPAPETTSPTIVEPTTTLPTPTPTTTPATTPPPHQEVPEPEPEPQDETEPIGYTQYAFIGNINSLIFHAMDCRSLPAPHNRIYFIERDAAIEAGHRPCLICTP